MTRIEQLLFGYSGGHRVLAASVPTGIRGADYLWDLVVLSDRSGMTPIDPRTREPVDLPVEGYLTLYPLPPYYVVQRTWPDPNASRPGCVLSHTLLVPLDHVVRADLAAIVELLRSPDASRALAPYRSALEVDLPLAPDPRSAAPDPSAVRALSTLWQEHTPVVVRLPSRARTAEVGGLLVTLWRLLSETDRARFSACDWAYSVRATPNGQRFSVSLGPRAAYLDHPGALILGAPVSWAEGPLEQRP